VVKGVLADVRTWVRKVNNLAELRLTSVDPTLPDTVVTMSASGGDR